eukprot:TRINITY_DN75681_c0_g1_i1.p1 TRINITY_DN75681_c0_g1~~TRINITY_DN75681_c0_g1_i1.p1  ORF type:complete len:555 (+),score=72.39 TRINITY_DN75681_c0_g1_i1:60-1667(+)
MSMHCELLEDGKLRLSVGQVAQYMRMHVSSQVECQSQRFRKNLEQIAEEGLHAKMKDDPKPEDYGIPDWACARSVLQLAAQAKNNTPPFVSLRHTAGQALPSAFMNMLVLWIFYPCYLLLVVGVSDCGREDEETALGIPSYPWWCWCAVMPVLAVSLCLQLSCLRYITLPKQQVLNEFKKKGDALPSDRRNKALVNLGTRNYYFYLLRTVVLSSLHVVDVSTDSAFVGTIISAYSCSGGKLFGMERYWRETIRHSVAARVLLTSWLPDFLSPCVILWAFGFVVPIYALVEALPVWSEWGKVDYEVAVSKPAKTDYQTYGKKILGDTVPQNHGAALMIVAEASGMHGIVHGDEDYAFNKAELELKSENKDKELKALEHVHSQAKRSVLRTLISGTCINCSQLNLQIIMLGLSCAITNKTPWDYLQIVLSICVGAAMTLLRIYEALRIIRGLCNGWDERCQASISESTDKTKLKDKLRQLRNWRRALVVTTSICAFWWMYAVMRLIFGFTCSSSLWNLSGCVHLSNQFRQNRSDATL